MLLDHVHSRPPRDRTEIGWSSDGLVDRLRDLRVQWPAVLPDLDQDVVAPLPWDGDPTTRPDQSVADRAGGLIWGGECDWY